MKTHTQTMLIIINKIHKFEMSNKLEDKNYGHYLPNAIFAYYNKNKLITTKKTINIEEKFE